MAQSQFTNELDRLTTQRDKALAEATAPIQKKFEELSGQLLKRATKAGDLDAAIKIKTAMQAASGQREIIPELQTFEKQLAGKWDCKSSSGWWGAFTFKEDGTFIVSQNGVDIDNGKWRKTGNTLKVIKQNGTTDIYELPIQGGKLVGKSHTNNTLNLSKEQNQ